MVDRFNLQASCLLYPVVPALHYLFAQNLAKRAMSMHFYNAMSHDRAIKLTEWNMKLPSPVLSPASKRSSDSGLMLILFESMLLGGCMLPSTAKSYCGSGEGRGLAIILTAKVEKVKKKQRKCMASYDMEQANMKIKKTGDSRTNKHEERNNTESQENLHQIIKKKITFAELQQMKHSSSQRRGDFP